MVGRRLRLNALVLSLGLVMYGGAGAQSTTGNLFGSVPGGGTVKVVSDTGLVRQATTDANGRYVIANLPVGEYQVTLARADGSSETRSVVLKVGAGTEASFTQTSAAGNVTDLGGVVVRGNANPRAIDMTAVDSRMVLTDRELSVLPITRNAESVALLAPGVVQGSANVATPNGRAVNTVSFGGAGLTENAYYVNGYNSTDPLQGLGGVGLPYGAIAQQETYIGGYSAMYGRSDGGVLNQIGKRGTNKLQFGGQLLYSPRSLNEAPEDQYFPNETLPPGYAYQNTSQPGTLLRRRHTDTSQTRTLSAYFGGPLVPDRLFFFAAAEKQKDEYRTTANVLAAPLVTYGETAATRAYVKVDWNITDDDVLELTGIKSDEHLYAEQFNYNYATDTEGTFFGRGNTNKLSNRLYIGKYLSYLNENLTLAVTYGRSTVNNPVIPGNASAKPFIAGAANQDPLITGGTPRRNDQTNTTIASPLANLSTEGLRVDLNWLIGNHSVTAGIDNMYYEGNSQGVSVAGPGYWWAYSRANPDRVNVPLSVSLGVGAPGGRGYYVQKVVFNTATDTAVDQTAYYIEDAWQATPNLLIKMGIRNDRFVNKNNIGQPYVDQRNQWAPRLGFSWDVSGTGAIKLFGNAGRYFLALPPSVAIRGASASTFTRDYWTYSGINADGTPVLDRNLSPGPVSSNGEYGIPVDPVTVASKNLKSQYQDEFMLGMDWAFHDRWQAGAKATLRVLRSAIDDFCDTHLIADKIDAMGKQSADYVVPGCVIFNPGATNLYQIPRADNSGYLMVPMTNAEAGFNTGPTRKYMGVDFYLEHPFDGVWQYRLDYTWSRLRGNTEGQVKSDTGQNDVSKTADWDSGALMDFAEGVLQYDRTHQIKMMGSWQFATDWLLTATARIQSGTPRNCLGYYGTNEDDPLGYGSAYHWCNGKPAPPGSLGRTPWTRQLNLGVSWRPAAFDKRLRVGIDVLNVTNERRYTQTGPTYQISPYTVNNLFGLGNNYQAPRSVIFNISYDY